MVGRRGGKGRVGGMVVMWIRCSDDD
jgi:hypothetical protein